MLYWPFAWPYWWISFDWRIPCSTPDEKGLVIYVDFKRRRRTK